MPKEGDKDKQEVKGRRQDRSGDKNGEEEKAEKKGYFEEEVEELRN